MKEQGISTALAETAGLVLPRKGGSGHYDRFRGRIIFPIRDWQGSTVAFGARILSGESEKEQPKYINSPETPVYNKSRVLYGLYQNKSAIRKAGYGVVVEGYMDLLALAQAGINNAAATLGTALTSDHVKFLKRVSHDWVVVFDGDAAGQRAAARALPLFYAADINVRVLTLPEEDDPDTFIRREGKEQWEKMLGDLPTGIDFVIDRGLELHGRDTEGKFKTVEEGLALIEPVKDAVKKSLFAARISQKTGVREESLWERLSSNSKHVTHRNDVLKRQQQGRGNRSGSEALNLNSAEAKLLGFLLAHPVYMEEFSDFGIELWIEHEAMRNLWEAMVNVFSQTSRLELSTLANALETMPEIKSMAMKLSCAFPPGENPELLSQGFKQYCVQRKKKALRLHVLESLKTEGENPDAESLLKKFQQLL
jgi:DNA primase